MPDLTQAYQSTPPQPHWAVEVLLDPRADLPELKPIEDYPNEVNYEEALGSFDQKSPGRVPYWFPREMKGHRLNPQQRLSWFDRALKHYAQVEWPPRGSVTSRKRSVALSLLRMQYVEELEGIPTPEQL